MEIKRPPSLFWHSCFCTSFVPETIFSGGRGEETRNAYVHANQMNWTLQPVPLLWKHPRAKILRNKLFFFPLEVKYAATLSLYISSHILCPPSTPLCSLSIVLRCFTAWPFLTFIVSCAFFPIRQSCHYVFFDAPLLCNLSGFTLLWSTKYIRPWTSEARSLLMWLIFIPVEMLALNSFLW